MTADGDPTPRLVEPTEAAEANRQKHTVLSTLETRARFAFRASKPHTGSLSPGCRMCGEGAWSCLFVHTRCDATCFFCPGGADLNRAPKDDASYAENLAFRDPERYAAYVHALGFQGVSFSGGEPFLQLERVLAWLRALRRSDGGRSLRIWLYTNGRLVTSEKLVALRDAGLDELRFDIAAVDYDLSSVAMAVGIIDTVTVEIPAVPEDLERVRALLAELQQLGVSHLHLHQLMVLGSNAPAFAERGYAVTRDANAGVVASELAALELLRHAAEEGLSLPVHYCSRAFKARWHVRAADRRAASIIIQPYEGVTQRGFIRQAWVTDGPLPSLADELDPAGAGTVALMPTPPRAILHASLLPEAARRGLPITVAYLRATLARRDVLEGAFGELRDPAIAEAPELRVLLQPVSAPIILGPGDARDLDAAVALAPYEQVDSGLPDYR